MHYVIKPTLLILTFLVIGCSGNRLEEKGFSVRQEMEDEEGQVDGIAKDSIILKTRPSSVLLTGHPQYRLTTIYKVNKDKRGRPFIGSNSHYRNYLEYGMINGNQWNYNFMPGLEAVYGYNMVNVSHFDLQTQKKKQFFDSPVLIKTLYFPSFSKDTLNYQPIRRDYYLVSVYDEDTNQDGFINVKDLRRFYYFDINAENSQPLVPPNYSVEKSEYDPANDVMFVFAKWDENENGQSEDDEPTHIYWVDLTNPKNTGRQY